MATGPTPKPVELSADEQKTVSKLTHYFLVLSKCGAFFGRDVDKIRALDSRLKGN